MDKRTPIFNFKAVKTSNDRTGDCLRRVKGHDLYLVATTVLADYEGNFSLYIVQIFHTGRTAQRRRNSQSSDTGSDRPKVRVRDAIMKQLQAD